MSDEERSAGASVSGVSASGPGTDAVSLVSRLFRPLAPGERKTEKLDVTIQLGADDEYVRVIGFEPLDSDDLAVLQGLMSIAMPDWHPERVVSEDRPGQQLRLALAPRFSRMCPASREGEVQFEESFGRLLEHVGPSDAPNAAKRVRESLLRLSNITLVGQKGRLQMGFHPLVYEISGTEQKSRIKVRVNLREVMALLGASDEQHGAS